jgi:hypothetical protein
LKNTGAAGIDLAPVLDLVEHGSALDLVDVGSIARSAYWSSAFPRFLTWQ